MTVRVENANPEMVIVDPPEAPVLGLAAAADAGGGDEVVEGEVLEHPAVRSRPPRMKADAVSVRGFIPHSTARGARWFNGAGVDRTSIAAVRLSGTGPADGPR
jgi:hypothetical protein